jgi:hypothetical protein
MHPQSAKLKQVAGKGLFLSLPLSAYFKASSKLGVGMGGLFPT